MIPVAPTLAVAGDLHWLDVLVLLGYLFGVSWLGVKLAGKSDSADRFFRGGGIPWPAVSASMIATAVSAVTFIAVPAIAFRDGGDFRYLQLGLVAGLLSRLIVAGVLVPAYFRDGVLSPYDFMANRLGARGPLGHHADVLAARRAGPGRQGVPRRPGAGDDARRAARRRRGRDSASPR